MLSGKGVIQDTTVSDEPHGQSLLALNLGMARVSGLASQL